MSRAIQRDISGTFRGRNVSPNGAGTFRGHFRPKVPGQVALPHDRPHSYRRGRGERGGALSLDRRVAPPLIGAPTLRRADERSSSSAFLCDLSGRTLVFLHRRGQTESQRIPGPGVWKSVPASVGKRADQKERGGSAVRATRKRPLGRASDPNVGRPRVRVKLARRRPSATSPHSHRRGHGERGGALRSLDRHVVLPHNGAPSLARFAEAPLPLRLSATSAVGLWCFFTAEDKQRARGALAPAFGSRCPRRSPREPIGKKEEATPSGPPESRPWAGPPTRMLDGLESESSSRDVVRLQPVLTLTAEDAESAEGPSLLAIIAAFHHAPEHHRSAGMMNALLPLRSSATSAVGLRCFRRGGAAGALILGVTGRGTIPVLGCTLLVDSPILFLNIVLGGVPGLGGNGALDLPLPVPCSAPVGLTLNAQVGLLDWAAPQGLSMSNGLEVSIY